MENRHDKIRATSEHCYQFQGTGIGADKTSVLYFEQVGRYEFNA